MWYLFYPFWHFTIFLFNPGNAYLASFANLKLRWVVTPSPTPPPVNRVIHFGIERALETIWIPDSALPWLHNCQYDNSQKWDFLVSKKATWLLSLEKLARGQRTLISSLFFFFKRLQSKHLFVCLALTSKSCEFLLWHWVAVFSRIRSLVLLQSLLPSCVVLPELLCFPILSEVLSVFIEMKDCKLQPCIELALWHRCGFKHLTHLRVIRRHCYFSPS